MINLRPLVISELNILVVGAKTPPTPEEMPERQPVKVIQSADEYMAIFSKNHIAFGDGKSPWPVKES